MTNEDILVYIAWNDRGYIGPMGKQKPGVNQGKGYGAEEWNNDINNIVEYNGELRRFFYFVSDNVKVERGKKYNIIFWASDKVPYLIGYAENVTPFIFDENKSDRKQIVKQLNISNRFSQLVELSNKNDKRIGCNKKGKKLSDNIFKSQFEKYSDCFAYWYCNPKDFLWLEEPLEITKSMVVQKGKLSPNYRYRNPDYPDSKKARQLINLINSGIGDPTGNGEQDDFEKHNGTTRKALVKIRLQQSDFRKKLDKHWKEKCAVTGLSTRSLLIASHIKPHYLCDTGEHNDVFNGLLLSANLDALFDDYLISFEDGGKIIISKSLQNDDLEKLKLINLSLNSDFLNEKHHKYLKFHRGELDRFHGRLTKDRN